MINESLQLRKKLPYIIMILKAKFQCHPARCLLPVEIMERCGSATGPVTVELLPYLLPY